MRVYQIGGLDAQGTEVVFATTDTAALAIARLQEPERDICGRGSVMKLALMLECRT